MGSSNSFAESYGCALAACLQVLVSLNLTAMATSSSPDLYVPPIHVHGQSHTGRQKHLFMSM
eukprot:366558-Chlamydomonas_euryale.AAC.11